MQTITGIIHGKTIVLHDAPNIADGAEVEIVIRPSRLKRQPGEGFLRTEGALADDSAWDGIMEEVQRSRQRERPIPSEAP